MHDARTLLQDLALVLCVAAVTTVVFRRLRQPVVLGYLLAGLIVGPHLPIPLFVDMERVHTLSELGVILVMFSVGLEFSVRKLVRVVPTSGIIGVVQIGTMMSLGYVTGRAFGWSAQQSLFTGAMVAISSTMIVAKVFAEQNVSPRLAETVFGVLVVQDLAAVLLLAVLTAISSGHGLPGAILARTAGQLTGFLVAIIVVGFLVVPRTIRAVARLQSPETLLLTSIGVCFALALIAQKVGYSIALGAFLAGSLIAESGEGEAIEVLIRPVRDVFAAIFFVAVGMVLDPRVLLDHWAATLVLVVVVIAGQISSVSLGAFLGGRDLKTSVQAGMSLAQIGEFSFIIASVGVEAKAIDAFLYPVAVAVAVVTTFTTPWLVRASGPTANFIDRRLPKPLQTFVSLYGSWVDQLRASEPSRGRIPRLVRLLVLDVLLLAALFGGMVLGRRWLLAKLEQSFDIQPDIGRWLILAGAVALSAPFLVGVVRIAHTLGQRLGEAALPPAPEGKLDLAVAPRRALIVTFQLAIVLVVGIPLLILSEPFLSPRYGLPLLLTLIAALAVAFWRGALNLHDHVQAGAQMIIEVLGKQSADAKEHTLDEVNALLPGLGPLTPVRLAEGSVAIGKTLAEINLRAVSGASVITILRGTEGLKPTGREALHAGDVLALAGTHDAIESARLVLSAPAAT